MKRTLDVCLLAGILALCLVKGAASPIVGTWEGSKGDARAATITVRETGGILGGSVIFYIIVDQGSGLHNGDATPPLPMVGTEWDGRALRFSVANTEGELVAFELRVTGEGKAELKRPAQGGDPEMIVKMQRAR
jgi:hypothetical protein